MADLAAGSQPFAAQVEGMPELKRQFSALSDRMQRKALRSAFRKGGRVVVPEVKRRAPYDPESGHPQHLRDDITVSVSVRKTRVEARIGFRPRSFYGRFNELGTAFQAARPFLRPALTAKADEVVAKIADSLRADILRIAARAQVRP